MACFSQGRDTKSGAPPLTACPPHLLKVTKCINYMNLYNIYFCSKGTGPRTVQVEALNQAGAKAQVEARYPWGLQRRTELKRNDLGDSPLR